MAFERTATRLWKRLTAPERLLAAQAFCAEPPQEAFANALGAIIKARRMRPQVARSLTQEEQAKMLATVLDPGETVAASLLVALHLGDRRPLLVTFLDALQLPHENGLLKDDAASTPIDESTLREAVRALAQAHPRHQVETYLNTLWQQDPERWSALEESPDWL